MHSHEKPSAGCRGCLPGLCCTTQNHEFHTELSGCTTEMLQEDSFLQNACLPKQNTLRFDNHCITTSIIKINAITRKKAPSSSFLIQFWLHSCNIISFFLFLLSSQSAFSSRTCWGCVCLSWVGVCVVTMSPGMSENAGLKRCFHIFWSKAIFTQNRSPVRCFYSPKMEISKGVPPESFQGSGKKRVYCSFCWFPDVNCRTKIFFLRPLLF